MILAELVGVVFKKINAVFRTVRTDIADDGNGFYGDNGDLLAVSLNGNVGHTFDAFFHRGHVGDEVAK